MLEDKKEALKEAKNVVESVKKAKTKDYTVLKAFTTDKVNNIGSIVSIEIGSELEKYLLTTKKINKHGISRSN